MHPLRPKLARLGGALLAALALCHVAPLQRAEAQDAETQNAAAQTAAADIALAAEALRDFARACAEDAGALWGRSLCGATIIVHPATRAAVASDSPPGGVFRRDGAVWIGRVPDGIPVANTSLRWVDRDWAMALMPLGRTRFARLQLLAHEAFHRIQQAVGIDAPDALNAHLDEHDGRYWLRLELRALAAALTAPDAQARAAARDALLFRRARHAVYPGADSLEKALELSEGLAEYTGYRVAMDHLDTTAAPAAAATLAFERRPSYARALGYGTGPALGLLLDRWAPDWRTRVSGSGLAPLLASAVGFEAPEDPGREAAARAARYGGEEIAQGEETRAAERDRRLADYRRRLIEGPALVLEQDRLMRAFDPNTLVPFPGGTIYPTGTFSAPWGKLQVDSGGAFVSENFDVVRVEAPAESGGSIVRGPGWTLELAEGWSVRRDGDCVLRVVPPVGGSAR